MTIVYKTANTPEGKRVTLTLEVPEDALTNFDRTNAIVKDYAKYRVSKVKVLKIEDKDGNEYSTAKSNSYSDKSLSYEVDSIVEEPTFNKNKEEVCAEGIHVFLAKEVAELYGLDGIDNGLYQIWCENGRKFKELNYKNGKIEGLYQDWYGNGQKSEKSNYKNGKKEGLYEEWYKNGEKWVECTYNDGKLDGLYQSWHKNGQKEVECTYKNGNIDGLYQSYHEDGMKRNEYTYKNGFVCNN